MRLLVQRDEGGVEAYVLGRRRVGRPRGPLPQELMDEDVLVAGVLAQFPGHGETAVRLLGGGRAIGDVRGAQLGGQREQPGALPHVNIPVQVDLGHGLSSRRLAP
ncbi:hypothetical protein ACIHAA_10260 [Streptomyces sp. NPDC052040]|uniref:hypothetical protein n=1 Tax=unclassified Streptomyces TaxID=2593676 RepID=UPI0037D00996